MDGSVIALPRRTTLYRYTDPTSEEPNIADGIGEYEGVSAPHEAGMRNLE
jgi:hypothetical protein